MRRIGRLLLAGIAAGVATFSVVGPAEASTGELTFETASGYVLAGATWTDSKDLLCVSFKGGTPPNVGSAKASIRRPDGTWASVIHTQAERANGIDYRCVTVSITEDYYTTFALELNGSSTKTMSVHT